MITLDLITFCLNDLKVMFLRHEKSAKLRLRNDWGRVLIYFDLIEVSELPKWSLKFVKDFNGITEL